VEYCGIGAAGPVVSRVCLGMMSFGDGTTRAWHLDEDAARPVVRRAVESGVTFFDTADVYSGGASEVITGRLLASMFRRREDFVLGTKVGLGDDGGLSRKHILAAIDASLTRLGVDHVDLYQIHRWDDRTPIAETMATLHELVQAGKVRHLGASSMYAWQFAKAQSTAREGGWTPFASMQNHLNLVYREEEREMLPLCQDQGVGVVPYSPLARGLLAGNRDRAGRRNSVRAGADPLAEEMYDESDFDVVDAVRAVAAERGVPPARIALAWLLGHSAVSALVLGATTTRHVEDAVAAVDLTLTGQERLLLEAPYRPHRVLGHS
jgi:aryl-alcohol dehydrogenase-like predicted oxidoreductase